MTDRHRARSRRLGERPRRTPRSQSARTPARDPEMAARMRQNADARLLNRGQHPGRLILGLSEPRVRRGQHDVEDGGFVGAQIQPSVAIDVRFDALQQTESTTEPGIDLIDRAALPDGVRHGHAAGDFETVRMVRDGWY